MKVRIHKPHIHAGTRYVPGPDGLVLDLPRGAVEFIEAAGSGKRVGAPVRAAADERKRTTEHPASTTTPELDQ